MLENDQIKVLWDFKIQTDLYLDHNRPDIVVLEKKERVCYIIDVACPFDMRVLEKEREKIDHYHSKDLEMQEGIYYPNYNWSALGRSVRI